MDSVSFARREGEFCCAETGERHKVARLKRMNVPQLYHSEGFIKRELTSTARKTPSLSLGAALKVAFSGR